MTDGARDSSLWSALTEELRGRDVALRRHDGPFLSVVLRTNGQRPAVLRDILLCFAAQNDSDFEVLLLVQRDPDHRTATEVHTLVLDEVPQLATRVRLIDVDGSNAAQHRNEAIALARGAYVTFVEENDLVLMNWVATFHEASQVAPGRILRTIAVEQPCRPGTWSDGEVGVVAHARVQPRGHDWFTLGNHVSGDAAPNLAYAFPRRTFDGFDLRFDESLRAYEEWDLQLRAIRFQGVHVCPVVTAVHRTDGQLETTAETREREERLTELARRRTTGKAFLIDGEELLRFRLERQDAEELARTIADLTRQRDEMYEEKVAEAAAKEQAQHELSQLQTGRQLAGRLANVLWKRVAGSRRRRR